MSSLTERMEMLEKQRESQKTVYDRFCEWLALRAARRGAIALEEAKRGSVGKLDLKALNIASSPGCALGQTYGRYENAPMHLIDNAKDFGFIKSRRLLFFTLDYPLLNAAWRKVAVEYGAKPAS